MSRRNPAICHLIGTSGLADGLPLVVSLVRASRPLYRSTVVLIDDSGRDLGPPDRTVIEELELGGTSVHAIRSRPGLDWGGAGRLEQVLHRERVDLIHAHRLETFRRAMVARLFYSAPPVLLTATACGPGGARETEDVAMSRMLIEARDRFVATSRFVRSGIARDEGIPPERIDLIYHGISCPVPDGRPGREGRLALRREIDVDPEAFVILQVGPLDGSENHSLAIRAMGRVVREIPHAQLVLAGEGPDLELIREKARRRGLGARVRFLGAAGDRARLLGAADVLLLPGLHEGIPAILMQALSAGRPVVATRAGGVPEAAVDRVRGLLAPPGSPRGIARRLVYLAGHPDYGEKLGNGGRRLIRSLCKEGSTSARYLRTYESMLRSETPSEGSV